MAKKKNNKQSSAPASDPNALLQQQMNANQQMFNLDLDERKRAADMQNAQFIAEQMRLRMETEMVSRGYLVQPVRDGSGNWTGEFQPMLGANGQPVPTFNAAAQAREIALREGEFELTKIRAEREYGLTYQDQQFRQAMESRQQQWTETYQQAQTALAEGDLTGYYNGQATLAREKQEADQSGYMSNGQSTLARQTAEWNAVLNAPRGPADYAAYMNRMRGIAASGNAPGVIGQFINGGPIASVTGNPNSIPRPATNTELAMSLVYGPNGQPQGYQPYGAPPGTTPANGMVGGWPGDQPPPTLPGGGYIAPPGWVPPGTTPGTPSPGTVPGGTQTPYPWQSPPTGGWGTPTGGATTGQPTGPINQGALAQAIYGQGLQGVGHYNIDAMSQADFDNWLRQLHEGGSGFDDPRIAQIAQVARSANYNMGAYDNWAQNGNGKPWLNPIAPPPAPAQPIDTTAPVTTPGDIPSGEGTHGTNWSNDTTLEPAPYSASSQSGPIASVMSPPRSDDSSAYTQWASTQPGQNRSAPVRTAPGATTPQMPETSGYGATTRMFNSIFGGSNGSSPYGGSAYSTPATPSTATPASGGSGYTGARSWSAQQFKKLSPTEQQYTLGWNSEENAETPEDAAWLMQQGSPNFRKSRLAQMAGIG